MTRRQRSSWMKPISSGPTSGRMSKRLTCATTVQSKSKRILTRTRPSQPNRSRHLHQGARRPSQQHKQQHRKNRPLWNQAVSKCKLTHRLRRCSMWSLSLSLTTEWSARFRRWVSFQSGTFLQNCRHLRTREDKGITNSSHQCIGEANHNLHRWSSNPKIIKARMLVVWTTSQLHTSCYASERSSNSSMRSSHRSKIKNTTTVTMMIEDSDLRLFELISYESPKWDYYFYLT